MKRTILIMLMIMTLLSGNVVIAAENGAGSDTYSLGKMYFSDLLGNEITKIDGSGMVNVTVTKNVTRSAVDSLIISSYTTGGELIGFAVIRANPTVNCSTELGTMIKVPEGKEIGLVKAYIWNNIGDMIPLSNVAKKNMGEVAEDDLPETVKVNAKLTSSYKNTSELGSFEFSFDNVQCLYDYIEGASEADYNALYGQFMLEDDCSFVAKSYLAGMDKFLLQNVTVTLEMDESMNLNVKHIERVDERYVVETDVSLAEMNNEYTITVYDEGYTTSIECELDMVYRLFVNGVRMDYFDSGYIEDSNCGDLVLADTDENGYYDTILVEYWGTAIVDEVSGNKIIFRDYFGFTSASVNLDPEDKVYNIYYEGERITINEVLPGDILSIAYDVLYNSNVNYSDFCDIRVSRNVISGTYSGHDDGEKTVTVRSGTEELKLKTVKDYNYVVNGMTMGDEYKFYIDSFGRIFEYEIDLSAIKYAIFDKVVNKSEWDNLGAGLYLPDGTYKEVEIDLRRTEFAEEEIYEIIYENDTYTNANKTPVHNRVVQYKVSSSTGRIIELDFLRGVESTSEYRTRTQAIGSVRMSDKTKIIDAIDYVDAISPTYGYLSTLTLVSLADGVEYTAYGFGEKYSDNTYPFVVITRRSVKYTDDTPLAVAVKAMRPELHDDGREGFLLPILYRDEETELFVTDDVEVKIGGRLVSVDSGNCGDVIVKGDVIVFKLNGAGEIEEIDLVWRSTQFGDYEYTVEEALTRDYSGLIVIPEDAETWTDAWEPFNSDLTTSIVYGVIVYKTDNYFTLAQVAEGEFSYGYDGEIYNGPYTNLDLYVERGGDAPSNGGVMDINIDSDTVVYVYDSMLPRNAQFSVGSGVEIVGTRIPASYQIEASDGSRIIPWEMDIDGWPLWKDCSTNLALAKVVDGVATEVFFIVGEE